MATRTAAYARALRAWARRYPLAPRYAPSERTSFTTIDGVRLTGARLAGPPSARFTVVLVHGFLNSSRVPLVYWFARELSRRAHVIVPDLRGHGGSGGHTTLGHLEALDVAAAVAAAPAGLPVVTVGTSLGGAAVIRHAGLFHGVAGVIAVSAPGWWDPADRPGSAWVERLVCSRAGREFACRILRTRIGLDYDVHTAIVDLVGAIAPAFTVIAHDPADHYFAESHALRLYEEAAEPKALWLMPGAGHGSDVLTPAFAARVLDEITARLVGPSGD